MYLFIFYFEKQAVDKEKNNKTKFLYINTINFYQNFREI